MIQTINESNRVRGALTLNHGGTLTLNHNITVSGTLALLTGDLSPPTATLGIPTATNSKGQKMGFSLVLKDTSGNPMIYTAPISTNVAGAKWSPASDNTAVATAAVDATGQNVVMTMVSAGSFNLTVTDTSGKAPVIGPEAFTVVDLGVAAPAFAHLDLDGASSSGAAPVPPAAKQ